MTWEDELLAMWDDLEQQAEGLALRQRDAEVAELARSEYAEVDLVGRLLASTGREVELTVPAAGVVRGRLSGVGKGWCLVAEPGSEWVLALDHVSVVRGLVEGTSSSAARPVTVRLGIGSVLRRLAERRPGVVVVVDGSRRSGQLRRVGADFLELRAEERLEVIPFAAVAAVRARREVR